MSLNSNITELERTLTYKRDGVYVSTNSMKCFGCGKTGHLVEGEVGGIAPASEEEESSSAAAALTNTEQPVEKPAEVLSTETDPVPTERVSNTGCTELTVQAEHSLQVNNAELNTDEVVKNTQESTSGYCSLLEENTDTVMMETEQIVFKTPSKRKKNERGASMKHAKKADREIVQTESDAESDVSDTSVPIAAVNNVTNKEYSAD
ncbi:uncharacterized protein LOC124377357 [Tachysurus ichikawai]